MSLGYVWLTWEGATRKWGEIQTSFPPHQPCEMCWKFHENRLTWVYSASARLQSIASNLTVITRAMCISRQKYIWKAGLFSKIWVASSMIYRAIYWGRGVFAFFVYTSLEVIRKIRLLILPNARLTLKKRQVESAFQKREWKPNVQNFKMLRNIKNTF